MSASLATTRWIECGLAANSSAALWPPHADMHAHARLALVFAALAVFAFVTACARGPVGEEADEGPTIDAEHYVGGFCSFKCWRLEECGGSESAAPEDCEAPCVEDALEALPEDPCWADGVEVRRCAVRYAECPDVRDETLPAGSDACDPKLERLEACMARSEDD